MNLSDYLRKKRKELSHLEEHVQDLEGIDIPLTIRTFPDGFELYSGDYTLATDLELKKRTQDLDGGTSSPDGGIHTRKHSIYPQFYFTWNLESGEKQINIRQDESGEDVLRCVKMC